MSKTTRGLGKHLPKDEEAVLPALIPIDKRPDEEVLEEGGFTFDVDRHFLKLLPRFVQDRVSSIPHHWWDFSEAEIIQKTWPEHLSPDETAARLRISLWDEYDRCFRFKLTSIDLAKCLRGICTIGYFRSRMLADSGKVVFLCTPPPVYENTVRVLHQKGLSELEKILQLPVFLPDGTADAKIADVKRRIYESLDMRIKGAVVQRIDQRNMNINIEGDPSMMSGVVAKPDEMLSMDELESELKKLEATSARLSVPGGARAAEVVVAQEEDPRRESAARVLRVDPGE